MTALEAKEIATNAKGNDLGEILLQVRDAARKGEFKTYWYKHLQNGTQDALKEYGFKVSQIFSRNELLVTISWD
jgi:hypothetical protein